MIMTNSRQSQRTNPRRSAVLALLQPLARECLLDSRRAGHSRQRAERSVICVTDSLAIRIHLRAAYVSSRWIKRTVAVKFQDRLSERNLPAHRILIHYNGTVA
jgi:hypothetical protein